MSRLVRITVDLNSNRFMVERGRTEKAAFTEEERRELDSLRDQLEPYGDFTAFKDLSQEEIEKVTRLKKRRAELEKISEAVKTVWEIVPEAEVESVVLIVSPRAIPVYVENMPEGWLERLFTQQLIIESPQIYLGSPGTAPPVARPAPPQDSRGYTPDSGLSAKHNKVIETIYKVDPAYLELLEIKPEGDYVIVHPYEWLGEPWGRIEQALTKQFGESAAWISKGKGDRDAHWEVL
jgi:hypothetical protein